jgi:hypothetical protein
MYAFFLEDFKAQLDGSRFYSFFEWLPPTAASGTFCGVDRGVDPVNLGGVIIPSDDISGKPLVEKLKYAAAYMQSVGTNAFPLTHFILHPLKWDALAGELLAMGITDPFEKSVEYGYSKIKIVTATGVIEVLSDPGMPTATCLGLAMPKDGSNIQIISMTGGKEGQEANIFDVVDGDGLDMLRAVVDGQDATEIRRSAYAGLIIRAPGSCCRISI